MLLYNVESFQSETRKVISEYLLIIFKLHPHLIVDHHRDLLDFLGNLRSLTSGGEHCYMHLVSDYKRGFLNFPCNVHYSIHCRCGF